MIAVIHDVHEVMTLGGGECLHAPVIDDEQAGFGGLIQECVVAAVGLGLCECEQQARQAVVAGGHTVQAGLVSQGAGDKGFTAAAGAGDEQVVCALQPVALGQCGHLCRLQPLLEAVFDRTPRIAGERRRCRWLLRGRTACVQFHSR